MELYLDHISKKYKDKTAVDDVTLRITPGVWGLLGANGAGKTTLMRMIAGIMRPTAGQVEYDGLPIGELGGGVPGPVWVSAAGIRVLSRVYGQRLSVLCGGAKGS